MKCDRCGGSGTIDTPEWVKETETYKKFLKLRHIARAIGENARKNIDETVLRILGENDEKG